MSNYLSRLAARTGLLNQSQGTTSGAAPGPQEGTQAVQQHLEIQNEHATIQAPVSAKPEIGSITHTSAPMKVAPTLLFSSHHEEKIGPHVSGITPEHSSAPNIQHPIEKNQMLSPERNKAVVAEHLGSDSVELASPMAESKQTDMGSQDVASVPDSSLRVAQIDAVQADHSGNVNEYKGLLHNDVVRPTAMEIDNISPPQNKRSNMGMTKTGQAGQSDSAPLIRVLESKPAHKTGRNDSKPSRQHEQSITEQQFRHYPVQPSQINIQSITLEVHQAEPARTPAPAPAPRRHAPAPKQNSPSQTRLSRYYLKGW